jgi:lipoyl(octanoyl) transferase
LIPLAWSWRGRVSHPVALAEMEARRDAVLAGDDRAEHLLLLEHDPVITLGRNADAGHVLGAGGVPVVRTTRGGDVTVHAPGQIVVYPVVRLARGVLAHMAAVGGALAEELIARGVSASWRSDPAGVFVGERKIAACGVHVRRAVAIHGFALNVARCARPYFDLIIPCGLAGVEVTCLEAEAGSAPPLPELAASLGPRIARALGREPRHFSIPSCHRFVSR